MPKNLQLPALKRRPRRLLTLFARASPRIPGRPTSAISPISRIPAEPETVAAYLAAHAETLCVVTLNRRLAALAKVHRSHGMSNPTSSELVKSVLRGLKRVKGRAQRQAIPLMKEDLIMTLDGTGEGRDLRDRALLLIGFAGGFRRSALVRLTCGDIERARQGIILTLRRSKTDQTGEGRKIGIPLARGR